MAAGGILVVAGGRGDRQREGRKQDRTVSQGGSLISLTVGMGLVMALSGGVWARQQRAATAADPATAMTATLTVTEPAGLARTNWPVTAGVPLPRGRVRDPQNLRLGDGTTSVPVQARILSRWPDGSVRWVLLDWQADLASRQTRSFALRLDTQGPGTRAPSTPPTRVTLRETGGRIDVDTGLLQFTVLKTRFAMLDGVRLRGGPVIGAPVVSFLDIDGQRLAAQIPESVKVTEAGPLRTRIELRGTYGGGFRYVVRLDAFANQPFVRILHSVENHRPEPYTRVRQIGIDLPLGFTGQSTYRVGIEGAAPVSGKLGAEGLVVLQDDNEAFRIGERRQPGHAAGWFHVGDAAHGVGVVARYFWQEYPQSFQARGRGLTYNLWAPEAAPAKMGTGAAKTHEMVFHFSDKAVPTPAAFDALREPLLAQAAPQWIVSTGALRNGLGASPTTQGFLRELHDAYVRSRRRSDTERWDDSGEVHCPSTERPRPERPRRGFYGMFNWGDWNFPGYHDTTKGCDAWGNLEYDLMQVLALAYAATGDAAYADGMVAAARHFMDVDRVHYSRERPDFIGMNHPKNPLHFTFELGGVDLGHTWTEGLLSYYVLTGDDRSLDAARGIADYLVRRLRVGAVRGNPRQFGWPAIALVAMYDATAEERYRSAAIEYARRGMALHPPEAVGEWKMGILAEGVAYAHSVADETAMRDWLTRYATAVLGSGRTDARYFPAVAYIGRVASRPAFVHAATAAATRLKFGNWLKPFSIAGRAGFAVLGQRGE